jgi:uncharacterized membrane protein YgcG
VAWTRLRWAGLLSAVAVLGVTVLPVTAASAEPPFRVPGQITDRAGALTGGDQADVQAALDQLSAEDNVDLYVVYVDTFDDPTDSEQWTTQTAQLSSLGNNQILLAIAAGRTGPTCRRTSGSARASWTTSTPPRSPRS